MISAAAVDMPAVPPRRGRSSGFALVAERGQLGAACRSATARFTIEAGTEGQAPGRGRRSPLTFAGEETANRRFSSPHYLMDGLGAAPDRGGRPHGPRWTSPRPRGKADQAAGKSPTRPAKGAGRRQGATRSPTRRGSGCSSPARPSPPSSPAAPGTATSPRRTTVTWWSRCARWPAPERAALAAGRTNPREGPNSGTPPPRWGVAGQSRP